ncbi:hypothetical protein [Shimia biformata]|uniref:hypothetical protein n=1 Tax=Shimia biformata TaxID=1294299 RepID=UPI00194F673E|nr:hypothetical protein [Shimia biformata]
MPSKIFTYEVDGLSYTVTVYEESGAIYADITVVEGAMDVNAIFFGDDDFSGGGAALRGPLNMNGARLDGQDIQWDEAVELSRPGLGRAGTDKETYVGEGDTLTVELDIDGLDDIDVFGIRATSTTTESGSIKAVSDDPEEPDAPEDPEEPMFEKVGFGYETNEDGIITDGLYIGEGDLGEGEDDTFDSFLAAFEDDPYGDIAELETVVFYEFGPQGYPIELFRIDAPEGGFENAEDVLAAYDEAIENGVLDAAEDPSALIASLALNDPILDEPESAEDLIDDGIEFA